MDTIKTYLGQFCVAIPWIKPSSCLAGINKNKIVEDEGIKLRLQTPRQEVNPIVCRDDEPPKFRE